jgi:ribulose-5-phosphate 4-epimerase/fuculose-1-phosphate aldolase
MERTFEEVSQVNATGDDVRGHAEAVIHVESYQLRSGAGASVLEAVTVLATALDELGARIYRDLHIESGHIDVSGSPQLTAILSDFSAYADQCLAALDNPAVANALAGVPRHGDK